MATSKWFHRKFNFDFSIDRYAFITDRLRQAPDKINAIVADLGEEILIGKPDGKWSIKEHTGHLSLLERSWRIRFQDIREMKPLLSPVDLDNTATSKAGFNKYTISSLLEEFVRERTLTLTLLNDSDIRDESRTSLHPRLLQQMRMIDLAWFVAEHDDHHISVIREIIFHFQIQS